MFNDTSEIAGMSADSYMEVILESGASIELAPKSTKTDIHILGELNAETVKERDDDKFIISVISFLWYILY